MKPYYSHAGIEIYHGDCREVLPALTEVDLIVTDPPYGQEYESGQRNTMATFGAIMGDDGSLDVVAALHLAVARLCECRHIYVFGPFDLSPLPLGGVVPLVWDKGAVGMGNLDLPWSLTHEPLTFAVKIASKKNRDDGYGAGAARMRRGSVLRFARLNSRQNDLHPTEKPFLLLRELIESSSFIGETVLDPFAGSGSTLYAAKQEGRKAIGIEIEEKYCEIAAKRLAQEVMNFGECA